MSEDAPESRPDHFYLGKSLGKICDVMQKTFSVISEHREFYKNKSRSDFLESIKRFEFTHSVLGSEMAYLMETVLDQGKFGNTLRLWSYNNKVILHTLTEYYEHLIALLIKELNQKVRRPSRRLKKRAESQDSDAFSTFHQNRLIKSDSPDLFPAQSPRIRVRDPPSPQVSPFHRKTSQKTSLHSPNQPKIAIPSNLLPNFNSPAPTHHSEV